jgi:hypothetical protein
MTAAERRARIGEKAVKRAAELVAQAPPLTPELRAELALLLARPSSSRVQRRPAKD